MPILIRSACLILLLGMLAAAPATAQGIVILARGPGAAAHPVGSTLRPGTTLGDGDRIDVLERGGTRALVGPARYVPLPRSTASQNVRKVVGQLLDRRQMVRDAGVVDATRRESMSRGMMPHRPSAVRTTGPGRYEETLWMIDLTAPATTCFRAGEPPVLWRPIAADPAEATIAPPAGGALPVHLAPSARIAPWPGAVPDSAGDYRIAAPGVDAQVRLVPVSDAGSLDDLVVMLDGAGCTAQLGYLLDQYPAQAER